MTQAAEALPDDPETLKAMLIAERQRAERLVQIIKDLQRHRFGPRPRHRSFRALTMTALAGPMPRQGRSLLG